MTSEAIGRNAPCRCGSGRKSKRCCAAPAPADRVALEESEFDLGLEAERRGWREKAVTHYRRVVSLNARNVQAYINLGNVLSDIGLHEAALAALRQAMALAPQMGGLHLNLAVALQASGRLGEAIDACRRAVAALPELTAARASLATMLRCNDDLDGAEQALAEAAGRDPANPAVHAAHGAALAAAGRPGDAVHAYRRALGLQPNNVAWRSSLIGAMLYVPGISVDALHREMDAFDSAVNATVEESSGGPACRPTVAGARRLRVGYVSADLREHSVAYFIEPVLEMHDRARVEVFCYSSAAHEDYVTQRIKAQDLHWRACASLDDRQLAKAIHADGIDILFDLSGHTAGSRPGVFALRPAPIQITWLGYPGATGLRCMDAIIGDDLVEPAAAAAAGADSVIRLSPTFSCYRPPPDAPAVAPLPLVRNGHVTLGCFNNLSKISDDTVAVWSRLLLAMPDAVLLLKHRALGGERTQAWMRERFAGYGVSRHRLQFLPRDAGLMSHFSQYAHADLALDPFPYCGVTTTCEALWMGVPVVSLVGGNFASRTGLSILSAVGHPEWAARTRQTYIEKVLDLCADPQKLSEIRAGLRARVAASPLVDARGFTKALEDALISRWQRHCRGSAAYAVATAIPEQHRSAIQASGGSA